MTNGQNPHKGKQITTGDIPAIMSEGTRRGKRLLVERPGLSINELMKAISTVVDQEFPSYHGNDRTHLIVGILLGYGVSQQVILELFPSTN